MNTYRYTLEKYTGRKSRYNCPRCGNEHKNTFARYIDIETGQYLHNDVGRCNRAEKCGYHYKPKQFFEDNGNNDINTFVDLPYKPEPPTSFLPGNLTNSDYKNNHLYTFLTNRFNKNKVDEVLQRYKVGSSDKWEKSTVFYQFDKKGRCRTGKIMQYTPATGKRVKKPYNRISWLHTKIDNYNLKQCLLGEHLVKLSDKTPIAIVESEKTALIMAIVQPECIWLATGGLSNLNKKRVSGLGFRKIVLFPDSGCADMWHKKVEKCNGVNVCYDFEKYPKGSDLADIVLS